MLDLSHIAANVKNVQAFYAGAPTSGTSWQTWQKPRGVNFVEFLLLGGGGGGGSGSLNASTSGRPGGGGGGQCKLIYPAWAIPNTLYVSVGLGGAGGGPVPGSNGGNGTNSYVSIFPSTTVNYILAQANGSVFGATAAAVTISGAPLAGLSFPSWAPNNTTISNGNGTNGSGGNGSGTGDAANNILNVSGSAGYIIANRGGGSGGNLANGTTTGGAGGGFTVPTGFPAHTGGAAGIAGTNNGNGGNGLDGYQPIPNLLMFYGGTGGGSAARTVVNVGGNGGNGGYGSGGGGGGGAFTGGTIGRGGRGGDGFVIVTAW
jgi:hypothetical protein